MDGLPDSSRSAEAYGLLLAAELEQATVLDEPLLAACTDQSKAYDMVNLDLLQYLLGRSGMPDGVWKTMLSMATALRRIRRVAGAYVGHCPGLPGGHVHHVLRPGALSAFHHGGRASDLGPQLGR